MSEEISSCTSCGYQWKTGADGSHSCFGELQKFISETVKKWTKEAETMVLKEQFFEQHGMKLDLLAQRELTNALYKEINELDYN